MTDRASSSGLALDTSHALHPAAAHASHMATMGSSTAGTLIAAAVGGAVTLVAVYVTNWLAERREVRNRTSIENLHSADRAATEQVHRANREDDLHREQMRELRPIVDDATRALFDLWSAIGPFLIADSRELQCEQGSDGPRAHMMEERPPSVEAFHDAYQRALDAHHRLLLRVEWNDTLHAPVGAAVSRAQEAWNAVVHETQTLPLEQKTRQQIARANQAAQQGYRELQDTACKRFAPAGLRGSERALLHVVIVRDKQRAEPLLAALRATYTNRTEGPSRDKGRFTIRDSEAEPGEARETLEAALDAVDAHWRDVIELQALPGAE